MKNKQHGQATLLRHCQMARNNGNSRIRLNLTLPQKRFLESHGFSCSWRGSSHKYGTSSYDVFLR